jgi:hypothetical protein
VLKGRRCSDDATPGRLMTKAELEAKRVALVAGAEAIIEAHERLRFTPADSPEHAAHRHQIQIHQDSLRAYLRERQASSERE